MKYVLIGQATGASMDEIMAVYPRHKVILDQYLGRGDIIGVGPFADGGNMAIFRSQEAAEAFAAEDPFALEGLIAGYTIRPWLDEMLS